VRAGEGQGRASVTIFIVSDVFSLRRRGGTNCGAEEDIYRIIKTREREG
jgi:hypothetical protein